MACSSKAVSPEGVPGFRLGPGVSGLEGAAAGLTLDRAHVALLCGPAGGAAVEGRFQRRADVGQRRRQRRHGHALVLAPVAITGQPAGVAEPAAQLDMVGVDEARRVGQLGLEGLVHAPLRQGAARQPCPDEAQRQRALGLVQAAEHDALFHHERAQRCQQGRGCVGCVHAGSMPLRGPCQPGPAVADAGGQSRARQNARPAAR
jgi:hypothetical protein